MAICARDALGPDTVWSTHSPSTGTSLALASERGDERRVRVDRRRYQRAPANASDIRRVAFAIEDIDAWLR